MFQGLLDWAAQIRKTHIKTPGRVLEVGSLDVNGNPRSLFPDATEYIGVDMRAGRNVDRVVNGHDLEAAFMPIRFDTVLCFETLEHDAEFWRTLAAIRAVLKPGGMFLVTTPTLGFPAHRYPKDYYRFTEDAYRDVVLAGYRIVSLETVRARTGSPCLCGAGVRA